MAVFGWLVFLSQFTRKTIRKNIKHFCQEICLYVDNSNIHYNNNIS
jgi:hypothetical protein